MSGKFLEALNGEAPPTYESLSKSEENVKPSKSSFCTYLARSTTFLMFGIGLFFFVTFFVLVVGYKDNTYVGTEIRINSDTCVQFFPSNIIGPSGEKNHTYPCPDKNRYVGVSFETDIYMCHIYRIYYENAILQECNIFNFELTSKNIPPQYGSEYGGLIYIVSLIFASIFLFLSLSCAKKQLSYVSITISFCIGWLFLAVPGICIYVFNKN